MEKQEKGYVYIFTNPSFREDWVKIGKSVRPVDVRSKELDNTAVPLPFEIFATIQTTKYDYGFKFSMVGIPIGEMITFVPTGIQVRIASDDTVEYEGRIYKLSPFVGTFMPEDKRNHSGAYQGAKFFSYKGKILDDLRTEMEALL